jgi:NADH:ubiquinone oxidoreductase subunit K
MVTSFFCKFHFHILTSEKLKHLDYVLVYDFPSHLWFTLATFIFILGMVGLTLNNQNFLVFLLKVELMLVGVNLFFIGVAYYTFSPTGLVYSLLLFGMAASESIIGLALFYLHFKKHNSILLVTVYPTL